ncbi:5-(carboxyamino)imidazole ribonucleotide synthase [Bacillus suaedaesalsae]|uniref:N5-carboxyaminoimidazole ribonucleotide synthase n=1 Tax=Bacillus suaedaesalsae TaxID=2810349 RepID=A0ABS2DCP4_9BACI|nr:5-(carboxyamino)imidazole ribonucleotide synthase [Bacillus suaedaesalsae]
MISLYKTILPGSVIGIIGGGQLGRMMAIAAKEMGYRIAVLDPATDSPCGQVADVEIKAHYHDMEAIRKLASVSDVITYEFENIDHEALVWLQENTYLPQGSELLRITQDREIEKREIVRLGVPVAPYQIVKTEMELEEAVVQIGLPCVVKTCLGGYDGKGQVVVRNYRDIEKAYDLLLSDKCIVEGFVSFEKELSVIVSRSPRGDVSFLPLAENIHVENILHQTIVPARVDETVTEKAILRAKQIAEGLNLVGTLAVEMFLVNGDIYVNELAPRPHNSGHYSIEACESSQFEQHIRAICNLPLGGTRLLTPVVMVNVLGEHVGITLDNIELLKSGKLHLYGKKEAKRKRKMGHITFIGESVENIIETINALPIWNEYKMEVQS